VKKLLITVRAHNRAIGEYPAHADEILDDARAVGVFGGRKRDEFLKTGFPLTVQKQLVTNRSSACEGCDIRHESSKSVIHVQRSEFDGIDETSVNLLREHCIDWKQKDGCDQKRRHRNAHEHRSVKLRRYFSQHVFPALLRSENHCHNDNEQVEKAFKSNMGFPFFFFPLYDTTITPTCDRYYRVIKSSQQEF